MVVETRRYITARSGFGLLGEVSGGHFLHNPQGPADRSFGVRIDDDFAVVFDVCIRRGFGGGKVYDDYSLVGVQKTHGLLNGSRYLHHYEGTALGRSSIFDIHRGHVVRSEEHTS